MDIHPPTQREIDDLIDRAENLREGFKAERVANSTYLEYRQIKAVRKVSDASYRRLGIDYEDWIVYAPPVGIALLAESAFIADQMNLGEDNTVEVFDVFTNARGFILYLEEHFARVVEIAKESQQEIYKDWMKDLR